MIIYNITIKVDWSIASNWLQWMQQMHIPEILATGCFENHKLVRLLQVDETDGPTYAVQYYTPLLSKYEEYLLHYAPAFQKLVTENWGNNYVDFRTLMEEVK